ncbi:MAG: Uncharacterised protein [Porticoccaceae bacterium UBA1117]|nr:MAG: Uncharacterised protein [Porticoccaceae bacterium UBA1117]
MVLPPGLPVASIGFPSSPNTIVGVIDDKGRFPGSIELAMPPINPKPLGVPGLAEKSSISLFNKNPAPATEIPLP